jgi:eukaryotic-like serine/threonine-protein kinase
MTPSDRELPATQPEVATARRGVPLARDETLAEGTLVAATYRVLHELGSGGMGTVYFARDEGLDRDVALKLIRSDLAGGTMVREQLRAEARTMARLSHPNVVKIHALGELETRPFIVMEHVPGISLSRFLRERTERLGVEEALVVLDQVCRGVSAIHAAGLLHRDIKPANVLVGPAFRIVVLDLGLSQRRGAATNSWGTPAYLAPELADSAPITEDLAPRVDVYALGVMAYELLTGTLPFVTDLARLAARVDVAPPMAPSQRCPSLDPAFDAPILEALAWSPELRTPSVDVFRRALIHAALASHPVPRVPLRFLVVDDDEAYTDIARRVLVRAFPGATVETAPDGPEGLEAARRHPPDLAVIDLDMPRMNGVELTAALQAEEKTARVPVIIASAIGGPADWSLLERLGASAFLGKPYDPTQLTLLTRMLLGRSARERIGASGGRAARA